MTDPRNDTNDPILALKLAISDANAERRELRAKTRITPEQDDRIRQLNFRIPLLREELRAQLRETLKARL